MQLLLSKVCESLRFGQSKKTWEVLWSVRVFFAFKEKRRPDKYYLWEENLISYMNVFSLYSKCEFNFRNSSLKTLVVFSAIFVADTKIIFRYDFVASLMFCTNFSFAIFSLMFFPLCLKVFSDILKIYELPKINNKISKYCPNSCLNKDHLPVQFYIRTSSGFWTIPLLSLLKMCSRVQMIFWYLI